MSSRTLYAWVRRGFSARRRPSGAGFRVSASMRAVAILAGPREADNAGRLRARPVERVDRLHDRLDPRARELRIDREREHLGRGALGLGEGTGAEPERRERGLQVERHRIVDHRRDVARREVRAEGVAVARPDDVLVEDVRLPRRLRRDDRRSGDTGQARLAEERPIPARDLAPTRVPGLELPELHAERGRLEGVEARAEAERAVDVRRDLSLMALPADVGGDG